MSDALTRIIDRKREHLASRRALLPPSELRRRVSDAAPPRGFAKALRARLETDPFALIAEIKRASPSRGLIRANFHVPELALAYRAGGATCLSVLTDEPFFQGHDRYVAEAREVVSLPVLRKDFIIDPYQIGESRLLGADCILLIMAALSDTQARELAHLAREHAMDILLEVHDERELERGLHLPVELIGINNRDLRTFAVDLATTERLAPLVPDDRLAVAESGIGDHKDLQRAAKAGARTFLVGESLMAQTDVGAATRNLLAPEATLP